MNKHKWSLRKDVLTLHSNQEIFRMMDKLMVKDVTHRGHVRIVSKLCVVEGVESIRPSKYSFKFFLADMYLDKVESIKTQLETLLFPPIITDEGFTLTSVIDEEIHKD